MSSLDLIWMLPPEQQDQIINGPALAPPNGTTPNFQHPPNQSIIAEVITPILVAVVTTLVLLRFCSKVLVQRSVHIEDGKYSPHDPNFEQEAENYGPQCCVSSVL